MLAIRNAEPSYLQVYGNESKFGLVEYRDGKGELRLEYQLTKSQIFFAIFGFDANQGKKIKKVGRT